MTVSQSRRSLAQGSCLVGAAFLLASLAPTAGFAADGAEGARSRKKIQEVDLHRLEIQGRLDNPASVFLLEKGATPLSNLWTLDGLLSAQWIVHVEKETLDRCAAAAALAQTDVSRGAAADAPPQ